MDQLKQTGVTVIDHAKHTADVGALTVMLGSLTEILPAIAALLSVIWMMIRIYETKTVQQLLGNAVAVDDSLDD